MATLYCERCGYKLEKAPGKKIPPKCPYCAEKGTLKQAKTAQDWLNEVASIEERD
ncbi:MAG: hypothetical protein ABIG95_06805 [Candidatus Woesearchaeota archaeon]